MDNILEKIKNVANQVFECDINNESSQKNCNQWDSLHHLNFIVDLEMEFDISFEPEEISIMSSITEVEKILKTKLQ